jgi:hypothetical protein
MLDDLGISKKQSSDCLKLAQIPQREFDLALTESERLRPRASRTIDQAAAKLLMSRSVLPNSSTIAPPVMIVSAVVMIIPAVTAAVFAIFAAVMSSTVPRHC